MSKPTAPSSRTDPFVQHVQGLEEFARNYSTAKLQRERSPASLNAIIRKVDLISTSESDKMWAIAQARADAGQGARPACSAGCDHCCHQVVGTTIPEVLYVAEHVRNTFSEAERESLRTALEAYVVETAPFRDGRLEEVRRPCIFLNQGYCSIYDVRPAACRWFNSVDLGACVARRGDPSEPFVVPTFLPLMVLLRGINSGMRQALQTQGLDSGPYEFLLALKIALEEPNSAERYLAGEDLFEPAREQRGAEG